MKKGILMENKRNYSIFMCADGSFYKGKVEPGYQVGADVYFEPMEDKTWIGSFWTAQSKRRMVAVLTALLVMLLPLFGWYDSNKVYAYVNIDINPSVELKVNNDMKVVDIEPLNQDARELLEDFSNWKKEPIQKVTLRLIQESKDSGYATDKGVLIGVSYTKNLQTKHDIIQILNQSIQTEELVDSVITFEVPKDTLEKAHKEDRSMNELFAELLKDEKSAPPVINQEDKKAEIQEKIAKKNAEQEKKKEEKKLEMEEKKKIKEFFQKENKDNKEKKDSANKGNEKKGNPPGQEKKQLKNKNEEEVEQRESQLPPGLEKKDKRGNSGNNQSEKQQSKGNKNKQESNGQEKNQKKND
ncbi:hypothetical protein RZN22_06245 [Bacillaceae bacterium S4-13-58]